MSSQNKEQCRSSIPFCCVGVLNMCICVWGYCLGSAIGVCAFFFKNKRANDGISSIRETFVSCPTFRIFMKNALPYIVICYVVVLKSLFPKFFHSWDHKEKIGCVLCAV